MAKRKLKEAKEAAATEPLRVAGADVSLVAPPSASERWDVLTCNLALHRKAAAALGMCWPRLRIRLRKQGIVPAGDMAVFSGRVFDFLVDEGATAASIYAAGARALDLVSEDLPGFEGVEDEMGNSEGMEDSTTG